MNRVGSSLPNCSGTPVALKRSVRDFDRSIASDIISGVAVRGTFLAVDVDPSMSTMTLTSFAPMWAGQRWRMLQLS